MQFVAMCTSCLLWYHSDDLEDTEFPQNVEGIIVGVIVFMYIVFLFHVMMLVCLERQLDVQFSKVPEFIEMLNKRFEVQQMNSKHEEANKYT
eukprot:UN16975